MTIGPYTLTPIETGTQWLDGGAMFGVVPKPLWERNHPADERNRIRLALRCLLIQGPEGPMLVDTGMGTKFTPELADRYGLDNSDTDLIQSLAAENLAPSDIVHVILTHLHFDHAGGATTERDGQIQPTFPNATYHVQRENWDWAVNPTLRDRQSYLQENFMPLQEAGQLRLLEGPGELWPGIRTTLSHGHTTGMQVVHVADSQTELIYCADLIPTRSHVRTPWTMGYDLRPLQIMEEKKQLLEQAVERGSWLFLEHDDTTAQVQVERHKGDFRAKPAA